MRLIQGASHTYDLWHSQPSAFWAVGKRWAGCRIACNHAMAARNIVSCAFWGIIMLIAMIGSGYVGLVSGACLADFGHTVVCIDSNGQKIEALRAGKMPIFEPGLHDLVGNNVRQRRLSFSTDLATTVARSQAVFIAVGTPSRRGDGHADLSFVYHAARAI